EYSDTGSTGEMVSVGEVVEVLGTAAEDEASQGDSSSMKKKQGLGSRLRERLRSQSRERSVGPSSAGATSSTSSHQPAPMERQSSIEDEESGKTIYRPPSAYGDNRPLTLGSKVQSARGNPASASTSPAASTAAPVAPMRGSSPSASRSYASLSRATRGASPSLYSTTYSRFRR
ncbi:unnamed protein product, partial [Notodromas monacha]